jgi:hypothetical protein
LPALARINPSRLIKMQPRQELVGLGLRDRRRPACPATTASAKHLYQYALRLVNHGVGSEGSLKLAKRARPEWHYRMADEPELADIDEEEGGSDGDDYYVVKNSEEEEAAAEEEAEVMDVEEEGLLPSNWILLRSSWLLMLRLFCNPLTVCALTLAQRLPPPRPPRPRPVASAARRS